MECRNKGALSCTDFRNRLRFQLWDINGDVRGKKAKRQKGAKYFLTACRPKSPPRSIFLVGFGKILRTYRKLEVVKSQVFFRFRVSPKLVRSMASEMLPWRFDITKKGDDFYESVFS
jgi:hypothetical protein